MENKPRYRGRVSQIGIYFGKLVRMFLYQNDWKMLLMAALIAGLVTIAVGPNLFKTQEGTLTGCFAVVCVCVWNGFFNSIQVVCRERGIVKREHRSGMHISSYIAAHMMYQLILCVMQTAILLLFFYIAKVSLPKEGLITPWFLIDAGISMLLVTYTADILALVISCLVRNTTTAMTLMPFLLIFQLIFSGEIISLQGPLAKLKVVTIVHWGQQCLCTLGNYNTLPMVSLWNMLLKFKKIELNGQKPVQDVLKYIEENGLREKILLESGRYNGNDAFAYVSSTILHSWGMLILMALIFTVIAVILLKLVDRDKR